MMNPFKRETVALWVVLLVAAALRFHGLGTTSLNNDELSAITRADHQTFSAMIEKGVLIDYHPAGVEAFLFYWIKLVGNDTWIVRLPFVLLSLLSIFLIYRSGKRLYTATAGLLAAAVFAVMELPLLYTTLARMYSPGIFFSVWAMYHAGSLLKSARLSNRFSVTDQVGFVVAVMLGVHTHYFVPVYLAGLVIPVFLLLPGKWRLRFFLLSLTGPLSFLPEIRVFLEQMKTGDLGGWLAPPEKDFLVQFFYSLFDRSAVIIAILSLAFLPVLFYGFPSLPVRRWRWVGVFAFLFSFGIAYGYSVLRHPALQPSTLLFSLPGLLLTFFSLLPERFYSSARSATLTILLLVTGSLVTVSVNGYYSSRPYGVFKEVAEDVSEWYAKYRMPVVVNVINPKYLDYYFSRMSDPPGRVNYQALTSVDLARLREQVDTSSSDCFAYVWTNCLHPYEIREIISAKYPCKVGTRLYFNAESILFTKGEPEKQRGLYWVQDFTSVTPDFGRTDDSTALSPPAMLYFSHEREFSVGFDTTLELTSQGLYVFYGSVYFRSQDTMSNATLDMKVEREGEALFYDNVRLNDFNLHPGRWQRVFIALPLTETHGKVRLQLYVWNSDHASFDVDKMEVKVVEENDPYARK